MGAREVVERGVGGLKGRKAKATNPGTVATDERTKKLSQRDVYKLVRRLQEE